MGFEPTIWSISPELPPARIVLLRYCKYTTIFFNPPNFSTKKYKNHLNQRLFALLAPLGLQLQTFINPLNSFYYDVSKSFRHFLPPMENSFTSQDVSLRRLTSWIQPAHRCETSQTLAPIYSQRPHYHGLLSQGCN